jgi:hypothetical protein
MRDYDTEFFFNASTHCSASAGRKCFLRRDAPRMNLQAVVDRKPMLTEGARLS